MSANQSYVMKIAIGISTLNLLSGPQGSQLLLTFQDFSTTIFSFLIHYINADISSPTARSELKKASRESKETTGGVVGWLMKITIHFPHIIIMLRASNMRAKLSHSVCDR